MLILDQHYFDDVGTTATWKNVIPVKDLNENKITRTFLQKIKKKKKNATGCQKTETDFFLQTRDY